MAIEPGNGGRAENLNGHNCEKGGSQVAVLGEQRKHEEKTLYRKLTIGMRMKKMMFLEKAKYSVVCGNHLLFYFAFVFKHTIPAHL